METKGKPLRPGQVFANKEDLALYFGCCWRTVRRDETIMRKLIPMGIYSKNRDFSGKNIRIEAMQHFRNNENKLTTALATGNFRHIEPFVVSARL